MHILLPLIVIVVSLWLARRWHRDAVRFRLEREIAAAEWRYNRERMSRDR